MSDAILHTLHAEYKSLMEQYHLIGTKITQIAELIKTYGGVAKNAKELTDETIESIVTDIIDSAYPIKGDWAAKIRFTLNKFNTPLGVKEIYDFICINEPDTFKQRGDNGRGLVSSIASRMARNGELRKQILDGRMFFSVAAYKK